MAYGRRSFGLDEYDNGHTPGSAGTLYNGSDMEDRRMGRLAQVLARSPYMQQVTLALAAVHFRIILQWRPGYQGPFLGRIIFKAS